ncbi:MAG: non-heme iron oxygenase ferredoxin subunit [Deltaproteobacteria bacterium]|nr:MAG: non-heme iron oxygenase ferredoxin subunit [Deltaproteobacteria bacterium]
MDRAIAVATLSEIPEGTSKRVEVAGRIIALFHRNGRFYALDHHCPHRGGPLGEGCVEGDVVICPWHGWQFRLEDGISPINPAARVATYPVTVRGDRILLALPEEGKNHAT